MILIVLNSSELAKLKFCMILIVLNSPELAKLQFCMILTALKSSERCKTAILHGSHSLKDFTMLQKCKVNPTWCKKLQFYKTRQF
jgi:hypothetical protein